MADARNAIPCTLAMPVRHSPQASASGDLRFVRPLCAMARKPNGAASGFTPLGVLAAMNQPPGRKRKFPIP